MQKNLNGISQCGYIGDAPDEWYTGPDGNIWVMF